MEVPRSPTERPRSSVPNSPTHPRTVPFLPHRIAVVVALTVFAAFGALTALLSGPAAAQPATSSAAAATTHPHHATPKRQVPGLNRRALAVARSKVGHPYVFGAAGPRTFDCSGLTQYSYARAGRHIPRVANAQFHAARRIGRGQLRPGDLVFYHQYGRRGPVFHVGMYVSHGMTVAAVDPAQGVTWQRIHYPDATFGSFTHR